MRGRPFDCGEFEEYRNCPMSQELAKILWTYDPETGDFRWNKKPRYQTEAGDIAGSIHPIFKYKTIIFAGKHYRAHRLAFLYMIGHWPPDKIDHINCDASDNRWSNLRPATQTQNHGNRRRASNNTSGYKGVSQDKRTGRFYAYLQINHKCRNLGGYDTAEEAKAVYDREAKIAFGEFYRAG